MMNQDNQSQKGNRFSVGIKVTLDDQVRVLRNTIAKNPNDAEAHKKLGFILSDEKYEKKDYREASEYLNKTIELGLDGLDIRLRLGAICLKIKEYNEAEKSFRKAIEFDSRCGDAQRGLGISLFNLKLYSEAKTPLRKALVLQKELKTLEVTETLAEIHINLAKVAFESKEYDECKKECESALELKPDFFQGYIWLGNIRYAKEDYHGAKEMFEKAINLNPKDAEPHYYLGLTFERLKRINDAEKEYEKAIELNPNFAEAHCKLGLLFKTQKRYFEAVSQLKKALELQSDLIDAKECLEELTSQPPEKVKEAKEMGKKSISEAETLIKEMEEWHCQSLPGYNEAINELNRAKDLMKTAHYYGYVEATSSAEKAIEIAKKCIRVQKGKLGEQFYQEKNKVEELLEEAWRHDAQKYFPERYDKLERDLSEIEVSYNVANSYEGKVNSLTKMNQLFSSVSILAYDFENKFRDEEAKRKWREEKAKENAKSGASIGATIGGMTGFVHCCTLISRSFGNAVGAWILHAILGALIGACIGYFSTSYD